MVYKDKGKLASILLFITFIEFIVFGNMNFRLIQTELTDPEHFERQLSEQMVESGLIDLSECTDFEWDQAYVIPPYYGAEAVYDFLEYEWTAINTYLGYLVFGGLENSAFSEGDYVLIFEKDQQVVFSKTYPNVGMKASFLFRDFDDYQHKIDSFTSDDDLFEVVDIGNRKWLKWQGINQ